ncbi:hypothetical protein [Kitasatospora sp. NBC_01266]|uniref:hypothetical protein n=1 Tax=Kitasatospora sp. NBC_01266 TaxID=2903572 RepID=UPI002E378ADD|nr:hypothetical protein [Kitasatospora sp. NBC_01266]
MSGVAPPVPYSWSVGDVGSAALLNAQLYTGLTFLLGPPVALYQQTTAQSLASGGIPAITWPTPTIDSYGGYNAANSTRYTPQQAGWYLFLASVSYAANATGGRVCNITKNGGAAASGQGAAGNATSSYNTTMAAWALVYCNGTTDYVETYASQNSGSALNTIVGVTQFMALFVHT